MHLLPLLGLRVFLQNLFLRLLYEFDLDTKVMRSNKIDSWYSLNDRNISIYISVLHTFPEMLTTRNWKMFFLLVTSVGQRKNSESHLRPSDLRSDALPLSHKDSSVSGVYYEVLMTRVLHTARIKAKAKSKVPRSWQEEKTSFLILHRAQNLPSLLFCQKHYAIDIADPSTQP